MRLTAGVRLTEASGEATAKASKAWTPLQAERLSDAFAQLRGVEVRRE